MADNRLGYHHYYCCNVDDSLPDYHHYYCNEGDSHLGYHHYCCNVDGNHPDYHHCCNEDDSHPVVEDDHSYYYGCSHLGYHRYYSEDDSHPAGVVDNCAVDVHFADLNQNLLDGIHHHCYNCDQSALNYKCADCEYVDAVCDFQFHDNCWNNFLMFVSSPHGCPHSVLLTDSEICFLILNPFF